MKNRLAALLSVFVSVASTVAQPSAAPDSEAAYGRMLEERVEKIVIPLGLTNALKTQEVRDLIVQQYQKLRGIHDERDVAIRKAKEQTDKAAVEAAVTAAREHARVNLDQRHVEFLKQLSVQLTPAQVEQVKDGMTYGVLNVTYNVYLRMFPELTDEQKNQIREWLVEARELAMDQGTAQEKHAVFGKYKGRINNYLSKAGYDLKKGEQNLRK